MEILAACDLTGSLGAAAALSGRSHHTVAGCVAARDVGWSIAVPVDRTRSRMRSCRRLRTGSRPRGARSVPTKRTRNLSRLAMRFGALNPPCDRSGPRCMAPQLCLRAPSMDHRSWSLISRRLRRRPCDRRTKDRVVRRLACVSRLRIVIALRDPTSPSVFAGLAINIFDPERILLGGHLGTTFTFAPDRVSEQVRSVTRHGLSDLV